MYYTDLQSILKQKRITFIILYLVGALLFLPYFAHYFCTKVRRLKDANIHKLVSWLLLAECVLVFLLMILLVLAIHATSQRSFQDIWHTILVLQVAFWFLYNSLNSMLVVKQWFLIQKLALYLKGCHIDSLNYKVKWVVAGLAFAQIVTTVALLSYFWILP